MTNKKKSANSEPENEMSHAERAEKIQGLREMITSAERTIQSAKAMLLGIEGKKKTGRKRKLESDIEGTIVQGSFDGQIMIGHDNKQYPVPANYASKSKLVEGDLLKLTITPDGHFIYKQIGPAERRHAIGIASQDERGNYHIIADGKPYRILLASVTYFRVEPGDEVSIIIPRDTQSDWAAIDNVLQKGKEKRFESRIQSHDDLYDVDDKPAVKTGEKSPSVIDEWATDIEEIEKEIKKEDQA